MITKPHWWICPNCHSVVDFNKEMDYVFEEDGEASFDAISGMWFHTITCEVCPAKWTISLSNMQFRGDDTTEMD